MQQSYYSAPIGEFSGLEPQTILGHLAEHHAHDLDALQRNAWLGQIELLQAELRGLSQGWIAFEFSIPRMGKRVDAILVLSGIIFVVEFKVGTSQYESAAIDQAIDYALDLKNFHAGSHDRLIVPLVVATEAKAADLNLLWEADGVAQPVLTNGVGLLQLLNRIIENTPKQPSLDAVTWSASGYKPTPTIIEAAQALYRNHRVEDITRSDAGAQNLTVTTACLSSIIEDAKKLRKKAICFVTGVPGAGKTLAGLNLVTHRTKAHEDEHAVFLSGNGPLVEVLREALSRDERDQADEGGAVISIGDARRKVKSFIQNIMHFRDGNLQNPAAPIERVAVFDEAQRAWDSSHLSKFMASKKGIPNFEMSEPEFLISVMDRHQNWCVIICLVGGGQEINAGEAGLTEWFSALERKFPNWKVFTSQELTHRDYHWGSDLGAMLAGLDHQSVPALHLAVSVRSFRAEKLSEFVGALVFGDLAAARDLYQVIRGSYPIAITRDLTSARDWLRERARGTERIGLVASSGAARLKPHGINVHEKIGATNWFLNRKTDVRSSFYLEDPATEFDIQGLELDWVGVCWDGDFRFVGEAWSHHRFRGTAWQKINDKYQKAYLTNAYRVLLTRARQGMVLYVPGGDEADPTRSREYYDGTWKVLEGLGLEII